MAELRHDHLLDFASGLALTMDPVEHGRFARGMVYLQYDVVRSD
jgi:hypothetical protein